MHRHTVYHFEPRMKIAQMNMVVCTRAVLQVENSERG